MNVFVTDSGTIQRPNVRCRRLYSTIEALNIMWDKSGGISKEVAVTGLKKKNLHCH